MSAQWMYITGPEELDLDKASVFFLYDYLSARMPTICPEYVGEFEGSYSLDSLTLVNLPAKDYHKVYQAIMQAADESPSVRPFKEKLKAALEADPRFKAV